MLYREIMAVCSEIHTKHTNTLCGQNVEFVNVKLVVHIVTSGLCKVTRSAVTPSRRCVSHFPAFCSTQLYIFATRSEFRATKSLCQSRTNIGVQPRTIHEIDIGSVT
jgi:hypothetical protein